MNKLVEEFEDAVRVHEFRGAAPPENRPAIEERYHNAKNKLKAVIKQEDMYTRVAKATGIDREDVKKVAHALNYSN